MSSLYIQYESFYGMIVQSICAAHDSFFFISLITCYLCFHMFFGSSDATPSATHTTESSTTYAKFPPKMFLSNENANNDAAAAGPTVRCIATIVCATPFVAPSERLFGAAENMYIITAPGRFS